MGITKDVVSDYGFDDTGATSNQTNYFTNVKPAMIGQDFVTLNYPDGGVGHNTYKFTGFFNALGVPNCGDLTINMTGVTISDGGSGGSGGAGDGAAFLWSSGHEGQIGIDFTTGTASGFSTAGGQSARIQTATIGATSVTLTAASASAGHISRFSVNQWMMVTGWATQGSFPGGYSYPNNFHWHDYVKITSIVGDTIFFTGHPLVNYYDEEWPELNRGTATEIDSAGPATIFAMSLDWDGTTTVNGGTLDITPAGASTFVNGCRREFTVNDNTQVGKTFYPSMTMIYRAINSSAPNVLVEHDKNVDLVAIQGGTYRNWKVQSSSTKLLTISGTTFTDQVQGTGRAAEIDTCDIQGALRIGPLSYGRGDTFRCTNSTISGAINGSGFLIKGTRFLDQGVQNIISMTNGLMTIPMSTSADILSYMMPDASGRHVLHWQGNNGTFGYFRSLSVTSDRWPAVDDQQTTTNITTTSGGFNLTTSDSIFSSGDVGKVIIIQGAGTSGNNNVTFITAYNSATSVDVFEPHGTTLAGVSKILQWGTCNAYIQTDQAGGLPDSSVVAGTGKLFLTVPMRSIYFDNCTGTDQVLDLCQSGAQNKPWGAYTKRQYNGQTGFTGVNGPTIAMIGNVTSLKVNVTKVYDGVSSLNLVFELRYMTGDTQTGTYAFYAGVINLKAPGERVMLLNGVTTGAQTGDSNLNFPATAWVCNQMIPKMSRDITAEASGDAPEFTVELITDQGFPAAPTAVVPLRLRLRAA
jgi:hypothetical protein